MKTKDFKKLPHLNKNVGLEIRYGKVYRLLSLPFTNSEDFIYLTKKYFIQIGYPLEDPCKYETLKGLKVLYKTETV